MSQASSAVLLPSSMEKKLLQIGHRQAVIAVLRAITVGVSVFIIAMVIAMVIDWQFTLFNTGVRLVLTMTSLVVAIGSSLIVGLPPLLEALKRVRAASTADAEIPQLQERWQTVVTLVESGRRPTSPAALAMLQQVTSEAIAIGRLVQPQRVADQTSLKTALKTLAVCSLSLIGFLATDWRQTSVLLRRFMAPTANISATSLNCISGDITVARGEFVNLVTEASGLQRAFATLSILRPETKPEKIEVAVDRKQANRFVHRIQADDSFQYLLRAGDGQTSWHQVTVIDYPSFAEVRMTVVSPAYLNRPNVEKSVFPSRLKVLQGSLLKLQMLPKGPLQRLELVVSPDSDSKDKTTSQPTIHQLTADADGWYRFQTQLMENISLAPQLWNSHGLTNEDRNVCRIQVIADSAPVARVLNSSEELSVANDDFVDIKFEANDDHGIAKAELVIYDESTREDGKPAEILKVIPIPLGDLHLEKHVLATTRLDLKKLDLKPGTQISYAVRVTDNRSVSQEANNSQQGKNSREPKEGDQRKGEQREGDQKIAQAGPAAETDPQRTSPGTKSESESDRSFAGNDSSKTAAESKDSKAMASNEPKAGADNLDTKENPTATDRPKNASTASTASEKNQDATITDQKPGKSTDANEKMTEKSSSKATAAAPAADPNAIEDSPAADPKEMTQSENSKGESSDRKQANAKKDALSSKPAEPNQKEETSEGHEPNDKPGEPANGEAGAENAANMPPDKENGKRTTLGGQANTDTKTPEGADQPATQAERSETERSKRDRKKEAQGDLDLAPSPPKMIAMNPQESSDGQDTETKRRRLKITARLSAIAESRQTRKVEIGKIRDHVVEIDGMLAEVEVGLTHVVNREIPDDDRSAQFKQLDTQLGNVEEKISTLRKQTRDSQYAFMGLQMVDIGRSHISPAREKVFIAIREPAISSDGNSRGALLRIVRARELLAALLVRYDRATQDQKLADSLEQGIKIYEIYIEKSQSLLREARQNQNALERKMAVLEVGQDYLDRYAEVLTMRRDMLSEFGRILGDDPRLLARYLDLVKRRRSSLRNQLSELSKRQQETTTELSGWVASDDAQRQDLWAVAVELRLQASSQLAKDSAEVAERIEKQFPLVLEATQRTSASVIELGRQIAETSRAISLEARRQIRQPNSSADLRPKARQLEQLFVDLDAVLERLNFENSNLPEVTSYVTGRLLESRTVADQATSWRQSAEFIHARQYHKLTEVDQHRLTIATELLRVDMLGIETELSAQFQQLAEKSVPEEIAAKIRELQQLVLEITFDQAGATFAMSTDQLATADTLLKEATESFAKAEELFDRIRVTVAAALDEITPRNPNVADLQDPKLDEFLRQLEREPNIEAQLGLPDRPRNLRVIADTMQWQEAGGQMLNEAEEAARVRTKQEMNQRKEAEKPDPKAEKPEVEVSEKERQERDQARESEAKLSKALAEIKEQMKDPKTDAAEREKLEQTQKELQQKLDELMQEASAESLLKRMKDDLIRTLMAVKEEASQPHKEPVDLEKIEQLTKDLYRIVEQVGNEPNSENRWKLSAEYERKKQILKALARGEHIPDEQWNKLLSALDDGLWQIGGRTLPEEYRKAIEQYQEQIRRLTNDSTDKDR